MYYINDINSYRAVILSRQLPFFGLHQMSSYAFSWSENRQSIKILEPPMHAYREERPLADTVPRTVP